MGITDAMAAQFARDLFDGVHQPGDDYRLVLLGSLTGTYDHTTADYVVGLGGDELASGGGYQQGGIALSGRASSLSGKVAGLDFNDAHLDSFTGTYRGIMVANATRGKVLGVFQARDQFGAVGVITGTGGPLDITLPRAAGSLFTNAVP
jgi:hypothetical protein